MTRSARPTSMRVALVHDWLTGMRGGEKTLEVLCELYPEAELFTLVHVPGSCSPAIERLRPQASFLRFFPGVRRYYRQCLPMFPIAVELFDLDRFDLVISTSHCAAKAVVRPGRARHLCYCHTPMRYVWDQRDAYFGPERIGKAGSLLLSPVLAWLARWDRATAGRVDRFVANSRYVARRIHRYYNREATVVYPPVDTTFYTPDGSQPDPYFLIVSALVPYKRIDVALGASSLTGVPLKIVGTGPELPRLRRLAGPEVELLGARTNDEIRELYRRASGVILCGEEDFGIVPVEAQACGRPAIALSRGGAVETVIDGTTGVLVDEPSVEAFASAMRQVQQGGFDPAAIRAHATRFSRERFAREIQTCIDDMLGSSPEALRDAREARGGDSPEPSARGGGAPRAIR